MNNGKAIAGYWEATFRGKLAESELRIFEHVLGDTALDDARAAIDDVAATGGFPPSAQRIEELAAGHRKQRLITAAEGRPELPDGHTAMTFRYWLDNVATPDEREVAAKVGPSLARRFDLDLGST